MSRKELDELKQQIPLLDYLEAHDWRPMRRLSRGRWMGLCPLHPDRQPSFLMDPGKNLFYCYGCGRGGDVIRFAELYHQLRFPQALALLHQWRGGAPLLHEVASFYRLQLHRHAEAVTYLHHRGLRSPELIEHMRIGYAPGGCLRGWLTRLGYTLPALRQAGLVSAVGYDTYLHRIVFPLEGNLYGRSLSATAPPHRFLPGAKGGLYLWEPVRQSPEVILVEGLFDYAALWQAGFHNVTCGMGNHLNAHQFRQLCDGRARTVYARRRNRFLRSPSSPCFFLNDHGRRLEGSAVRRTFYNLSRQIGLRGPEDHKGPRLHDFRHRFAVRTLVHWYRSNEDIERRLPVLSTFLGHGHVADTYWYLSVEPELMGLATRRLELRWGLTHAE